MRFTVPAPSEALLREIRVSQAVARVRQLPTVFAANPLLATFIAVIYWDHVFRTLLVMFIALQFMLWTPAILSWRRLRNKARPTRVSVGNERRATIFSAGAGLLWAVAAFVLYPAGGCGLGRPPSPPRRLSEAAGPAPPGFGRPAGVGRPAI